MKNKTFWRSLRLFTLFLLIALGMGWNVSNASLAHATTSTVSADGLVAYWMFDDGAGTSLSDSSGNGHTGTIYGATWVPGKIGQALRFDGASTYAQVPDAPDLSGWDKYSMEAWIYLNGLSQDNWQYVLEKDGCTSSSYGFVWRQVGWRTPEDPDRLASFFSPAADQSFLIQYANESDGPVKPSELDHAWHHFAATYDGTTLIGYLDGKQVDAIPATGAVRASTGALYIGGMDSCPDFPRHFQGDIDELKIYSRARTAAEIAKDANSIGCSVSELKSAINAANANPDPTTIELAAACTYTLTDVDNDVAATDGPNGLPPLTSNITINGNGAIITRDSTAPAFRILYVGSSGALTLNDATISGGIASVAPSYHRGGGIDSSGTLTVNRSTIANNSAGWSGGGIQSSGTTLTDVTLSGNSAAVGGAFFSGSDSTSHLERVTFVNNSDALFNDWRAVVTVGNSTFVGNSGAAINNFQDGTITVVNVTLSDNAAGLNNNAGEVVVKNSILANGCSNITDGGNNIDSDGTCGVGTATDPRLDPAGLKNNGGSTQTIALMSDSPAIGAGNDTVCAASPVSGVDQRRVTRPQGAHCDIGAFELENGIPIVTVDETNVAVQYSTWRGEQNSGALSGTYRESKTKDNSITFKFTGKSITWIAHKGPDMGIAQVTIDGVNKGTIDLYSATQQWQFKKTFKKLPNTKHTLVVKVLGTKNALASNTYVGVDAFKVGAVITDDTAPAVKFNTWTGKTNAAASGGSYRTSKAANSYMRFAFTGTSVQWLTAKGPKFGKATVLIDGVNKGTFDLYAANTQWQVAQPFTGLGAGQHTIEVRVLGEHNAASKGNNVIVDAFRGPFQ